MKFLIVLFGLVLSAYAQCPSDTKTWCTSVDTARACNVLEQCTKFVWKPSNPFFDVHMLNKVESDPDAVNLTLYYEVLCPDSRRFINGQLTNGVASVSSIMNLRLVPYGNAKEMYNPQKKLWQFTCQHGPDECLGNIIQSCFLYFNPSTEDNFPFVHCMELNEQDDVTTAAQKCGAQLNISLDKVFACSNATLGNRLEHIMAELTDQLEPKHTYVPWVTLNGVHTEDIEQKAEADLVGLICSTYKGKNLPPACKKSTEYIKASLLKNLIN